jgi:hypothetical protein
MAHLNNIPKQYGSQILFTKAIDHGEMRLYGGDYDYYLHKSAVLEKRK